MIEKNYALCAWGGGGAALRTGGGGFVENILDEIGLSSSANTAIRLWQFYSRISYCARLPSIIIFREIIRMIQPTSHPPPPPCRLRFSSTQTIKCYFSRERDDTFIQTLKLIKNEFSMYRSFTIPT